MMSKEEQHPLKGCLEDSMRTDSGTEEHAHNFGRWWNINIEHSGTFRNIPEHPGTSRNIE